MKVDVVPVGSFQRKLEFSVPAQRVREELDRAYREMGSRARLHGFRQGKVPRKVLEARFGPQIVQDVASSLIQQGWTDAMTEHKLEPVSRPTVEDRGDLAAGADFRFTITVDVKPEVELQHYTDLEVVYPPAEVGEDEIDQQVRARLEGQAKLNEVSDRPVKQGDMVIVELTAKAGDEEVVSEPGTMIRTEADPYYPGVEAILEGMALEETKTASVSFPESARIEAVAGRTLDVTVKVISITATEIPELTDELAKELGYEGGIVGMRAALSMQLRETRDTAARNQARANLLQALINANTFDVPQAMIEQHLQMLMDELKLQQAYRGRDPRRMTFSPEQMADLRVRAEFAAKGGIMLDFVSKKEAIAVDDGDLERKYQEIADQRGQTVEAIRGYFVKDDAVEELRARLLEEKTLDWLLERAKIVTVAPGEALAGTTGAAAETTVDEKPKKKKAAKKTEAEAAPEAEVAAAPAEAEAEAKPKKKRAPKKKADDAEAE